MTIANDNGTGRRSVGSLLSSTSFTPAYTERDWCAEMQAYGKDPAGDKMWALGASWHKYDRATDRTRRTRAQIIRATDWSGPPYGTCAAAGQVFRHFENEIRIPLPWSFYKAAKSLPPRASMLVLKEALRKGWSLSEMKQEIRRRRSPYQGRPLGSGIATSTEELVARKFRANALYADPAWLLDDGDNPYGGSNKHFQPIAWDKLRALPIRTLAYDTAFLFLWTPSTILPEALGIMTAWGFAYKGLCIWCKEDMGCGSYFRNAAELLLLGVLPDTGTFVARSMRNWFVSRPGIHSSKPLEVYNMIERAVPGGPFLELFATQEHPGWQGCGDMLPP